MSIFSFYCDRSRYKVHNRSLTQADIYVIIWFDTILFQCNQVSEDTKRCLKKVARGLNTAMRSGRTTMGKLKMIDSLNNLFLVRWSTFDVNDN